MPEEGTIDMDQVKELVNPVLADASMVKRKRKSPLNITKVKTPKNRKPLTNREEIVKTVRFTSEMDLELLREVCSLMPFRGKYKDVPKNWETLTRELKWTDVELTTKSIRRRFELLYRKFLSEELASLNGSGTEEDYDKKCQLLTDIKKLMTSPSPPPDERVANEAVQAEQIRAAAMEGMVKQDDQQGGETGNRGRNKFGDLGAILTEKNSQNFELRLKELEFKKDKFSKSLEQQERDRQERAEDRHVEMRKIQAMETANENQHKLMMKLIEAFAK